MPDKYDKQIEAIRAGKVTLRDSWFAAVGLFAFADRGMFAKAESMCLTGIKRFATEADSRGFSQEFVNRILLDDRIPDEWNKIQAQYLEAFADYQREIDRTLPSVRVEQV